MNDKKQLKQITDDLVREILLKSFIDGDEVDTRVNIYSALRQKEKTKDPNIKAAVKEAEKIFNDASYLDLIVMHVNYLDDLKDPRVSYDPFEEEKKEEEPSMIDENAPLYDLVFVNKRIKECSLYLEGDEENEYIKLKTFDFEGKHYVLLKNKVTEEEKYYFYACGRDSKDELKEKLVPLNDEGLIKFVEQLGL